MGHPGHGDDPADHRWTSIPGRAAILLFGITALYSDLLRAVGRDRDRRVPVRGDDGRLDPARRATRWTRLVGSMPWWRSRAPTSAQLEAAFGVIPPAGSGVAAGVDALIVFLAVQWWAAWYPGAEPGGGGYVVQRILSAKDERHGLLATLWFNIAHYALRPWPWILVGFVGADPLSRPRQSRGGLRPRHGGRPALAVQGPPARSLRRRVHEHHQHPPQLGRVVPGERRLPPVHQARRRAGGRRSSRPGSPRSPSWCSRWSSWRSSSSVEQGWKLLIGLGAGTGAGVHPALVLVAGQRVVGDQRDARLVRDLGRLLHLLGVNARRHRPAGTTPSTMLITVGVTTVVWLTVTLLTPPEPDRDARRASTAGCGPGARAGAGWPSGWAMGDDQIPGGALSWVNWVAGVAAVYCVGVRGWAPS